MAESAPERGRNLEHSTGPVLVVDDDAQLQKTIRWLLEDEGLTVGIASNGEEGLVMAETARPSLVILDLNLPVMDGEGVADGLRATYGSDLPIIVVSSDSMVGERAKDIGATAWLSKPFEIEELLDTIYQVLGQ